MQKSIIIGALMLILGFAIGILCRPNQTERVVDIQRDTIIYRDTIRESYPVEVSRETIDTMYVTLTDTIRIKEILYLPLPLEKKIYASDEYYAEISGYKPNLDYIEVFPKTKVVTKTIQPVTQRNALSIGVEMSYMNTLSTPIYLEYERMLHKNLGFYVQVAYDLPTKQYGAGIGLKGQIEW